jgi:LmbE family N-acetylglucosaminyl deacetylase
MKTALLLPRIGIAVCTTALGLLSRGYWAASAMGGVQSDPYLANDRAPDPRFKADILVVVAHADDETMVTSYLAREIFDHHRRVAVVYGTHSDGGNNNIGPEQAFALGDIREIEAREALHSLHIANVWFIGGHDVATQNVLSSLNSWDHGACLGRLVRIVRLTRPSVIMTFLPDFTTGENHSDHQAAGVLATEAFDLAGDPTAFPEQVSPAIAPDKTGNLTESLQPWQPEKIYYFYNPTHDIFAGRGPQYSPREISPSKHLSYGTLAAIAYTNHRTQGGDDIQRALDDNSLGTERGEIPQLLTEPVKLILGKSLVPSGITDDVFAGVVERGINFHSAPGFIPEKRTAPVLEIGDPWNFYKKFWQAHDLGQLKDIVPPEITVKVGGSLIIPLIIDNPLDSSIEVRLTVSVPNGWKIDPPPPLTVAPHSSFALRVQADAPHTENPGWQQFTVSAKSGGKSLGSISVRAELSSGWVAPQ